MVVLYWRVWLACWLRCSIQVRDLLLLLCCGGTTLCTVCDRHGPPLVAIAIAIQHYFLGIETFHLSGTSRAGHCGTIAVKTGLTSQRRPEPTEGLVLDRWCGGGPRRVMRNCLSGGRYGKAFEGSPASLEGIQSVSGLRHPRECSEENGATWNYPKDKSKMIGHLINLLFTR